MRDRKLVSVSPSGGGKVSYAPLYDHVAAWGIEGLVDEEFETEIKRRLAIFFQATQPGVEIPMEIAIDEYNVFHTHLTMNVHECILPLTEGY